MHFCFRHTYKCMDEMVRKKTCGIARRTTCNRSVLCLCLCHGEQAYQSKIDIGIGNRNRLNIIPILVFHVIFAFLSSAFFYFLSACAFHKTCNFPLWLSLDTMPLISIALTWHGLVHDQRTKKKRKRKIHQATEEEEKSKGGEHASNGTWLQTVRFTFVFMCNMQLNVSLYHCAISFSYVCSHASVNGKFCETKTT